MKQKAALHSDIIPCAAAGTLPGLFELRVRDDLLGFSFTNPYPNYR